jgi:hypothetical protein
VKRDHAGLCSYNPKQNGVKGAVSTVTVKKRGRSPGSEGSVKREDDKWPRTSG